MTERKFACDESAYEDPTIVDPKKIPEELKHLTPDEAMDLIAKRKEEKKTYLEEMRKKAESASGRIANAEKAKQEAVKLGDLKEIEKQQAIIDECADDVKKYDILKSTNVKRCLSKEELYACCNALQETLAELNFAESELLDEIKEKISDIQDIREKYIKLVSKHDRLCWEIRKVNPNTYFMKTKNGRKISLNAGDMFTDPTALLNYLTFDIIQAYNASLRSGRGFSISDKNLEVIKLKNSLL